MYVPVFLAAMYVCGTERNDEVKRDRKREREREKD